jgi:hypothetical protein
MFGGDDFQGEGDMEMMGGGGMRKGKYDDTVLYV